MTKLSGPNGHKPLTGRPGTRLIIILGIVILAAIAVRSALALVLWIVSMSRGGEWTGRFSSDVLPIIVLAALAGLCSFAIYKLVQILRM